MKKFMFQVEMLKRVYVDIEVERPDDWDPGDFEEDLQTGVFVIDRNNDDEKDNLKEHDDLKTLEELADEDLFSSWEIEDVWKTI